MEAVRTIAELKKQVGVDDTSIIYVLGYNNPGDGGGGHFYWDSASTEADDTGTIFETDLLGSAPGRWKRNKSDYINVAWFGAVGENDNYDSAFAAAVTLALNQWGGLGGTVVVPAGRYTLTQVINLTSNTDRINIKLEGGCQIFNYSETSLFNVSGTIYFSLMGDQQGNAEIRCQNESACVVSLSNTGIPLRNWGKIENISFIGNGYCQRAIDANNYPTGLFSNNKFIGFTEYNIYLESCWDTKLFNNHYGEMGSEAVACIALAGCTNSLLQGEVMEPINAICIQFKTVIADDIVGGNSILISACSFQSSSQVAIEVIATSNCKMDCLLIENCFFEGISPFNIQPYSSATVPNYSNIEISGCSVASPVNLSQASYIDGVDSLLITNTHHKMPITVDNTVNNFVSICNTFLDGTTNTLTYNGVNPIISLP